MSRNGVVAVLAVAVAVLALLAGFVVLGEAELVRTLFYLSILALVIGVVWLIAPPR